MTGIPHLRGERHRIDFWVTHRIGHRCRPLPRGLEDAEFAIQGQIIAAISAQQEARRTSDGSISVRIEALPIAE